MAVKARTQQPDSNLQQIIAVLNEYAAAHPTAQVDAYRWSPYSVRIRVLDPAFKGTSRGSRDTELWQRFEQLPDEVVSEIGFLLLLTPTEAKKSFANMDFENPEPNPLLDLTRPKEAKRSGRNGTKAKPFVEVLEAVDMLSRDEQEELALLLNSRLAQKQRKRRVVEEAKP